MFEKPREHGTAKEYNKGCRCEKCKKAKSVYRTESPIKGHGTAWYYSKGCRCDSCQDANQLKRKKYRPIVEGRKITTDIINMTRICYVCHEKKSLGEFGRNKNRRASMGRSHECRVCHNARGVRDKNTPAHRFQTYRSSAKVRKIDFALSFEEFMLYWEKPCYYCGDEIKGIGLDRKDPKFGYNPDNIVPCCGRCNRSKTIQTTDQFIEMCVKVAEKFKHNIVSPEGTPASSLGA
jgi:hypothetical protein